jgi:hypothetical protein
MSAEVERRIAAMVVQVEKDAKRLSVFWTRAALRVQRRCE